MVAIEDVMLDIVRSVAEGKSPVFTLRNQRDWKNVKFGDRLVESTNSVLGVVHSKFYSRLAFGRRRISQFLVLFKCFEIVL